MRKIIARIVHAMTLLCTALLLSSCEIEGPSSKMVDLTGDWTQDKLVYEVMIDDTWIPLMILEEGFLEESQIRKNERALVYFFPEKKKAYMEYLAEGLTKRVIQYVNGKKQKIVSVSDRSFNIDIWLPSYFDEKFDYDNNDYFVLAITSPGSTRLSSVNLGDKITLKPLQMDDGTYSDVCYYGYRINSSGEMEQVLWLDGGSNYEDLSRNSFYLIPTYYPRKRDITGNWEHNGERIYEIDLCAKCHFIKTK